MTELSNVFKAFANLPADDADDLHNWVTKSCHPRDVPNYEDAHLDILRLWLRAATGIQWVRGYEEGSRDSVDPDFAPTEGQYGTVHFIRPDETDRANIISMELDEASGDFCQISYVPMDYIYQLEVFRDAGEGNNREEYANVQKPIGSAVDPLMHLRARLELPIFQSALTEYCLYLEDAPLRVLTNIPAIVQGGYERRATAQLRVLALVSGSIRVPGSNQIDLEFCDRVPTSALTIDANTAETLKGLCTEVDNI